MENELVRNCKFKFKCNQQWEGMDETDSPNIRFCQTCSENVYLCETEDELLEAITANKCVAMYEDYHLVYPNLLGEVVPRYFTKN